MNIKEEKIWINVNININVFLFIFSTEIKVTQCGLKKGIKKEAPEGFQGGISKKKQERVLREEEFGSRNSVQKNKQHRES